MNILCVDVGRGTQDILFYDSTKNLENCTSLIIPSRGFLLEKSFRQAINKGQTPLFWGINMGGFPIFKHAKQFLEEKGKILATPSAAKTFHDNLNFLEEEGFKLISPEEAEQLKNSPDIAAFETRDIALDDLIAALELLGEGTAIDGFAIAVQDHGESAPGTSNRQFRFTQHRKLIENYQNIDQFGFMREQIPKVFTRMQAVSDSLHPKKPLLIMDTGWAAVLGALEDPFVAAKQYKIVLNVGNSHTLAVLLDQEKIVGLWEHHTGCLTSEKLTHLLARLADGTISHKDVFDDGGHGAYVKGVASGQVELIAVTGPNRMKFANKKHYLAAPHGNMMLSGSFGLLRAYKYHEILHHRSDK